MARKTTDMTRVGQRGAGSLGAMAGLLLAPLALLLGSLWLRVVGSDHAASEARSVRDFDEVALSGSGTLDIAQTGEESLVIQADDNILPLLTSDVSGHRLTLGMKSNTSISTRSPIVYRLTVKHLGGLTVSGSGDTTATGIASPSMAVRISGSGDVTLAGTADSVTVTVSGSGAYRGGDFATKTATVSVTGSGDARVNASEQLTVRISGSGGVEYSGNPAVAQRISGSGRVVRR